MFLMENTSLIMNEEVLELLGDWVRREVEEGMNTMTKQELEDLVGKIIRHIYYGKHEKELLYHPCNKSHLPDIVDTAKRFVRDDLSLVALEAEVDAMDDRDVIGAVCEVLFMEDTKWHGILKDKCYGWASCLLPDGVTK